ncbi:MAG: hypothetical protein GY835_22540 [bacterium]|nr:hypothetical protein [bacterium]
MTALSDLTTAIVTKWRTLVADQTVEDLSRQRDATTSENTTLTEEAAETAATEILAELPGMTSADDDYQACVSIGTRIMTQDMKSEWTMIGGTDPQQRVDRARNMLKSLSRHRVFEATAPVATDLDMSRLDKNFPTHDDWDSGDDDAVT